MKRYPLILASASPRRLDLLRQMNVSPDQVMPAEIDESPKIKESPKALAKRLAMEKAAHVYHDHKGSFVLAADTVVACGQQTLDKAVNTDQALAFIQKLSGRRHHVYGGISLITPEGKVLTRLCDTLVQFKTLTPLEIDAYIQSNEWNGKAGGYAIQGFAGSFVKYMAGSYSNVVGLSLYDTMNILKSGGYVFADE